MYANNNNNKKITCFYSKFQLHKSREYAVTCDSATVFSFICLYFIIVQEAGECKTDVRGKKNHVKGQKTNMNR